MTTTNTAADYAIQLTGIVAADELTIELLADHISAAANGEPHEEPTAELLEQVRELLPR